MGSVVSRRWQYMDKRFCIVFESSDSFVANVILLTSLIEILESLVNDTPPWVLRPCMHEDRGFQMRRSCAFHHNACPQATNIHRSKVTQRKRDGMGALQALPLGSGKDESLATKVRQDSCTHHDE